MQTLNDFDCGRSRSVFRFPARQMLLALCLLATFMTGCEEESEITTRTVPKPPKDRMLAAIVPVGQTGWFFKLSGHSEAVAAQEPNFRKLLKSLEIEQGEPVWETPDGWTEEPGEGMRKATFKVTGDGPTLECTVISLPDPNGDPTSTDYTLANINRWRGQLGMESLSKAGLEMELKIDDEIHSLIFVARMPAPFRKNEFEDVEIDVTWVNFEGRKGSGQRPPMGDAPFAGGAPHGGVQPGAAPFAGGDGMGSKGKGRILAAIVPVGKTGWFFKIRGDDKLVAAQKENFLALLTSLRIDGDKPAWQTPKTWHELAGSGFRAATFQIGEEDSKLECSVTPLPTTDPTANEYLLSNINRWRGQVGLAPINEEELISDLRTPDTGEIQIAETGGGLNVPWVNISSSSAATGPAPQPGAAPGPAGRPGAAARPAPRNLGLTYTVPSGWKRADPRAMVLVGWDVKRDGKRLQIYISKLGAAGSDLVANVNRWREQAGLNSLSGEDVQNTVDPITVGGSKGHSIEIRGAKKSITGAIVIRGEFGWFFKLQGDAGLAAEEKDNFEAWLKSIQFE
jgi:hypothetical protein